MPTYTRALNFARRDKGVPVKRPSMTIDARRRTDGGWNLDTKAIEHAKTFRSFGFRRELGGWMIPVELVGSDGKPVSIEAQEYLRKYSKRRVA